MIKVCEHKAKVVCERELSTLREENRGLRERYFAILRELRDKFNAIGFDDFLKILMGILGGYLTREISGIGIDAFKSNIVVFCTLMMVLVASFLTIRHFSVKGRKKEVVDELRSVGTGNRDD